MKIYYFLLCLLIFSCGEKKTIILPEVTQSTVNEVFDVSPAYIFYDETQTDSLELNRKNLIISTNWLVNIDKRLTLKQVVPQIKFLQEKKRGDDLHKNEAAKNYYTCNDVSLKNLGFIEFTDVYYHESHASSHLDSLKTKNFGNRLVINFKKSNLIELTKMGVDTTQTELTSINFKDSVKSLTQHYAADIVLQFNKNLTFQDYIGFKSLVLQLEGSDISVDNNEFVY